MKTELDFKKMKYGFFVHYNTYKARYMDGRQTTTYDEAADNFDVVAFADNIAAMKVEYMLFTAWHYMTVTSWDSAVMKNWRGSEFTVKRDMLGEMIDAVRAKGIKVFLYTHPRDGHDFLPDDQMKSGWGGNVADSSEPDPKLFDYEKWNRNIVALYAEMMDLYGDRIDGIYIDGVGPGRDLNKFGPYKYPVVNYIEIREVIKRKNPEIVILENGFGYDFGVDYPMPECFFGYERVTDVSDWPACRMPLALTAFKCSWACGEKYGEDVKLYDADMLAKFTVFQGTSTNGGGMCFAAGPYCEGMFDAGVVENMKTIAARLETLGEAFYGTVCSRSYPTVSGDTLGSRNFIFENSSYDGKYEYIHIMKMPEDGIIALPVPEDGANFGYPKVIVGMPRIAEFTQNEKGVKIKLEGKCDEFDTVIRLRRENNADSLEYVWINDFEKRIRYSDDWAYDHIRYNEKPGTTDDKYLGCYEYDCHIATKAGSYLDAYVEGDVVEIYGITSPDGGSADILIDDILVETINTKSDELKTRVKLFSKRLYGGSHMLSIFAKGDGEFCFDALRIGK